MASFGGFIASALGGAAKGYGEGAQMEMKKQAELDLKKQLLDAEAEKDLRVADINRQRINDARLADEKRVQSPAYLKAQADAEVEKVKALMASGLSAEKAKLFVRQEQDKLQSQTDLLPNQRAAALAAAQSNETSQADLRLIAEREAIAASASKNRVTTATAGDTAAAASAVTLAGAQADAKVAPQLVEAFTQKYNASKEFEKLKAKDATTAQIDKAKALAADKDYMEALKKTDLAMHAGIIRVAEIKAQGDLEEARARAEKNIGGGGTNPTTADLQRQVTAAENALAAKLTVKKTDLNEELGVLQKRTDSASKDKLAKAAAEIEALAAARKRLLEWSKTPAAAAPAAAASGAAASSFTPAMPPGFKGAAPPPPSKFKLD